MSNYPVSIHATGFCYTKAMQDYISKHADGSVWAKGYMLDGKQHGYFEWFRKDGTKMRSGFFDKGKQIGEWITYDKAGNVYKVTEMKDPVSEDMKQTFRAIS